jgi:hypothetical protein
LGTSKPSQISEDICNVKMPVGFQEITNTRNKNIKSHQKEHEEWKFI